MAISVFYSWQSDSPKATNRNFIENSLQKALKSVPSALELHEALREEKLILDKDTKDVPGTPPIVDVIFDKISRCAVFVPDLTFVGTAPSGRKLPNPNVLIEYGWALKVLGHSKIVSVMNTAFGSPTSETMPFDMRHLRHPITYHVDDGANEETRNSARQGLVRELVNAIQLVLHNTRSPEMVKESAQYQEAQATVDPSTFLQENETIPTGGGFSIGPKEVRLPQGQRLFVRIVPSKPLVDIKTNKQALDLVRFSQLRPLGCGGSGWFPDRNRYGAYVCSEENRFILGLTQLFRSGELWGIDTQSIDKKRLASLAGVDFGYFPWVLVEDVFVKAMTNYLAFARDVLKLELPLKFITGATNVEGYRMTLPSGYQGTYAGSVMEPHIVFQGEIELYTQEPIRILRPFFDHLWEETGLERPDSDQLR